MDALILQRTFIREIASVEKEKTLPGEGSTWYSTGALVTFWIVFPISWICCIFSYGFLLGVGLGWLPSLIVAGVAAALWPLLLLALLVLVLFVISRLK